MQNAAPDGMWAGSDVCSMDFRFTFARGAVLDSAGSGTGLVGHDGLREGLCRGEQEVDEVAFDFHFEGAYV